MADRTDGSPRRHWFGSPAAAYVALLPLLMAAAREVGYAFAVHGSLGFDLDLIAVPWTDAAVDSEQLISHLFAAIAMTEARRGSVTGPEAKPHGRLAWTVPMGNGLYLDISVMPRKEAGNG